MRYQTKRRPATGRQFKKHNAFSISHRPTVREIKAHIHVLNFYEHRLEKLVKRGRYAQCCCPFHRDHHPSFSVDCETGNARCFACGWSGDIVEFAMDFHGVSLPVALNYIREEAGL